jgi:hypothetical protein
MEAHMQFRKLGSQKGQSMPLVVVCALVLVICGVAAMQIGVVLNGSQQVRNAVDAGALNTVTRAPDIKVAPTATLGDVADTSGQLGVTNINRAIGKTLLINLNAESMKNSGQAGQSQGNAQLANAELDSVSQKLEQSLKDEGSLTSSFNKVASPPTQAQSPTDNNDTKKKVPQFAAGFVHAGQPSNVSSSPNQFPPNTSFNANGGLPGYTPLKANGQNMFFVPFKPGERPHLISTDEFNASSKAPSGWQSPILNSLQATGSPGSSNGIASVASAVINPQQAYSLSIPHAFVQITLPTTNVSWLVNGKQSATSTYQFTAETQFKVQSQKVGCKSTLNGYASVGNEYKGNTVLSAINGVPGTPAHMQAMKNIVQRVSEIDKSFNMTKLTTLLQQQALVPNTFNYILYPVYNTQDNSDPVIHISPSSQVAAGWFNPGATADGTEKSLGNESLQDSPNSNWGQVTGKWQLNTHHVNVFGQVLWTPGTGYNQCLGTLRLNRNAQVTFNGQCPN